MAELAEVEAPATAPSTVIRVPITKAKGESVEIDTSTLPDDVYREALLQGLKVLANRGTSKITKTNYPKADELKAAAIAKAQEQVKAMQEGKIKLTGSSKSKKASGAVMTEARRIAKALVKDAIKAQGGKVSHYDASEITKAANMLLEEDDGSILAQAQEEIAKREATKVKLDLSVLRTNPKKVEETEAKKGLSAKQAGMVAKRSKGKGAPATA